MVCIPEGIPVRSTASDVVKDSVKIFEGKFGSKPEIVTFGPGRVNLIGEHTDYQMGYVFPCTLDIGACVVASVNATGSYNFFSENMKEMKTFNGSLPEEPGKNHEWWNYVVGAVMEYFRFTKLEAPKGLNMVINSTVPLGGGLSSSAACEVAVATAMECLMGRTLTQIEKAENVCQKAEHVWAGMPCGLMDQAISVMGKENHAMLLNCKNKEATHAPLSDSLRIVIVDCGIRHRLVDGEYSKRKASCVKCVEALKTKYPEVEYLSEAHMEQLDSVKELLDESTYNKGKHVITECARCIEYEQVLNKGDFEAAGKLMETAHWSLSKDYEVSIPQVDKIVTLAKEMPGVIGARMTGGGFGGCVVLLCEADKAASVMQEMKTKYFEYYETEGKKDTVAHNSYGEPKVFLVSIGMGAHAISCDAY